MAYGIGTKDVKKCYDGNYHECEISDCSIILRGKTYDLKAEIKADGGIWWAEEKYWVLNSENEEEVERLERKYRDLGIRVTVKPNWRIIDGLN